jgi:hypothetical protein
MKKIICFIIIMCIFASTNVFAYHEGLANTSAYVIGVGGGFIIGAAVDVLNSDAYYWGAGIAGLGIITLIWALTSDDDNYTKAVEENQLFKNVSFATNGKKTFIGARFSF